MRSHRSVPLAVAALLLVPAVLAAQPKIPEVYENSYEIRYLDIHAAEKLAWDQCTDEVKNWCRVRSYSEEKKQYIALRADRAAHEQFVNVLVKVDTAPRTQRIQILLLAASTKSGMANDVPPNAQKALADIKDFLPYKSFRLLDTAWVPATQDRLAEGRLIAGNESYWYRLRFRNAGAADGKELHMDFFRLDLEAGSRPTADAPQPAGETITPTPPRTGQTVLSTAFNIRVGETVVVGTSKFDGGDAALVTLVTVLP
jgi:hypothetical protein